MTVAYGKSTTLSANLGVPGVSVALLQKAANAKAWSTAKTVTTDASGKASVKVTPKVNTSYQWKFAGTSAYLASTSSSISVLVSRTATAKLSAKSVKHGTRASVKLSGTVAPSATGLKVTLQQYVKGKWKTLKITAKTKKQKLPGGKKAVVGFVLTVAARTKGTFVYRVIGAAGKTYASATSPTVTLKVK